MQRQRPYWGNVSALKKKNPSLVKLLRETPRSSAFSLNPCGSFSDVCFYEGKKAYSLSYGSGCDCPGQRLAASVKQKIDQNTDVFLFLGFPNAALLQQVWAHIQKENKAVLIIEPSLELLAAQLEVAGFTGTAKIGESTFGMWGELAGRS